MTSLNFVDEYIIQKVVLQIIRINLMLHHLTLVIILNQDDYDFDSDDETPLSNLVKDNSSNNKNDNLNSL